MSIQAQVINLLDDLQDELHLTYVFIAHDLGVVRHVSDRIAVMYLGKIVEISPAEELYAAPGAPLHRGAALGGADPRPRPVRPARADRARGRRAEPDHAADRLPLPSPLPLRDRDLRAARSRRSSPHGGGHLAACHHPLDVAAAGPMVRRGPPRPDRAGSAGRGQAPPGALRAIGAGLAVLVVAGCAGGGASSAPSTAATHALRPPAFAGVRPVVARYLRARDRRVPIALLRVHVTTLARSGRSETVLATASARLGRQPGTAWVALGQRALVIRRRGGRLRVVADVTRGGGYPVGQDGAGAMPPRSRYRPAGRWW